MRAPTAETQFIGLSASGPAVVISKFFLNQRAKRPWAHRAGSILKAAAESQSLNAVTIKITGPIFTRWSLAWLLPLIDAPHAAEETHAVTTVQWTKRREWTVARHVPHAA